MRLRTFVVTFTGYMTVRIMRICLPFVQLHLQQFYYIHNTFIGIVSATSYIIVGLGFLFLVFNPIQAVLPCYTVTMGIAGLAYVLLFLTILL